MFTSDFIDYHNCQYINEVNYSLRNNDQSDEDCSCSSCECSSCTDEDKYNDNQRFIRAEKYSSKSFKQYDRFSMNANRPSISTLKDPSSTKKSNDEVTANQSILSQPPSIENHDQRSPAIDLEHIYEIINQSYTKLPIFYNTIKQTKLDRDFILSVNDYLDRLKANIYQDLIRRETLLRNGKNHTKNFISLIRCICKISYQQALEIPNDSVITKHAILYTMTAIEYILQINFPQKKSLFNYILNEFISMWLHESLRIIQEDFSIIVENGTKQNFVLLCSCLFKKFESICAVNWERLQMIQNYRLTHFNQLMKSTSIKLETNKDFVLQLGNILKTTMKKSHIPITPLYSNRTDNELRNIDEIQDKFTKCIAKILMEQSQNSTDVIIREDHPTPSIEITSSPSMKLMNTNILNLSKREQISEHSGKKIIDELDTAVSPMLDQQQESKWNIVSEANTQSIETALMPLSDISVSDLSSAIETQPFLPPSSTPSSINQLLCDQDTSIVRPLDKLEEQEQFSLKLSSQENQQLSMPIEMISKPNTLSVSSIEHAHQSSSPSSTSSFLSQMSTNISDSLTKNPQSINSHSELISTAEPPSSPVIPIKSEHQNDTQEELNTITQKLKSPKEDNLSIDLLSTEPSSSTFASPETPLAEDYPSHQTLLGKNITLDSKSILDTEVNALINFLTKLAYASPSTQTKSIEQEKETKPLSQQLEYCLKQNGTDPHSIIEQIHNSHPQASLSVKDPLFLAAFTRALRKELEDAQILRKIDLGQLNEDSQNIGHLPFETINILKLPKIDTSIKNGIEEDGDNIDQNRVFIEVTHDPSRCTPNPEYFHRQCLPCTNSQHQRFDHIDSPVSTNSKSMDMKFSATEGNNQQSSLSESNHPEQHWYWIRSNESSLCKDCIITADSLFCARKLFDKNTHSITVEHNEEFQ